MLELEATVLLLETALADDELDEALLLELLLLDELLKLFELELDLLLELDD